MNRRASLLRSLTDLVALFSARSLDSSTLQEIAALVSDEEHWGSAHDLFQRIRAKVLMAERSNSEAASAQYRFEEACAKTLYNLSGHKAPFDADAPYWIVPTALALAKIVGLPEIEVTSRVAV
jgi:hypothetical protein